ncbi:MAG: DUF4097 family beta strand repeat-containing protein [Acidobacteriota bacterium]
MSIRMLSLRPWFSRACMISTPAVLVLLALSAGSVFAQQSVSKRYPAGKNVRLQLKNISGKITVESWNRDEIKISATMESPAANVSPRQVRESLVVDVTGDNRGREIGAVNFKIQVPQNSSIDIETKMGDIRISNIRGDLVRAHVTLEGDIELTGITASQVYAQNLSGNIFFDGEVSRGGIYQFQSGKGDISIHIPADSTFDLIAAAPNKKIVLGQFSNSGFKTIGDGQRFSKFVGDVNDGRAKVVITNFQGAITFLRR